MHESIGAEQSYWGEDIKDITHSRGYQELDLNRAYIALTRRATVTPCALGLYLSMLCSYPTFFFTQETNSYHIEDKIKSPQLPSLILYPNSITLDYFCFCNSASNPRKSILHVYITISHYFLKQYLLTWGIWISD